MRGKSMKDKSKKSTYSTTFGVDPKNQPIPQPLVLTQIIAVKKWSGRRGSNSGPLAPHASALPDCATARKLSIADYPNAMLWQAFFYLFRQPGAIPYIFDFSTSPRVVRICSRIFGFKGESSGICGYMRSNTFNASANLPLRISMAA